MAKRYTKWLNVTPIAVPTSFLDSNGIIHVAITTESSAKSEATDTLSVDYIEVEVNIIAEAPTFTLSESPPKSYNTREIALGDIDGDGDLDFVIATFSNGENVVFKNNGTGNFTEFLIIPDGRQTLTLSLVDIDGDGDLDLIEGNYIQQNRVFRNNGSGNFTLDEAAGAAFVNNDRTRDSAVGDIDGDGDLDVVFANSGPEVDRIYTNDGTGTFTANSTYGNSITLDVELVDIDNDGDLDIIQGNNQFKNVIFKNDGAGSFTFSEESTEVEETQGLAVGVTFSHPVNPEVTLASGSQPFDT